MTDLWLLLVVAIPWIAAIILAVRGQKQRFVWGIAVTAVVCTIAAAVLFRLTLNQDPPVVPDQRLPVSWLSTYVMLDDLSWPFVVNIFIISLAVVIYARGYMHDTNLHLFYSLLLGFIGGMIGITVVQDGLLFFVFWESVVITSSLLIAGWGEGEGVGRVVIKYIIYTQAGSLMILLGLSTIASLTGSSNMTLMTQNIQQISPLMRQRIAILMSIGFCIKIAVFPLHTWLPDAHSVAPMPVTILLAACMLSMGAYGILRFPLAILGLESLKNAQFVLMLMGLTSGVYGGLMCLVTQDIKRLVAYSSVSQMGYVLFGLATLMSRGVSGSILHIVSHGILKAMLFMGVGLVIRSTGKRRLDELGGLAHTMPREMVALGLGAIALAGVPPFCAFHSEWMILEGGFSSRFSILGYLLVLVPLLSAAYALTFVSRLAFRPAPVGLQVHRTHPEMRWPFYALLLVALVLGLFPAPAYEWVKRVVTLIGLG